MDWLINASVWLQTPIVIAVLLLIAVGVAWLLNKGLNIVMPRSDEEQRVLGAENLRGILDRNQVDEDTAAQRLASDPSQEEEEHET